MKQIYALIKESAYINFAERFPEAISVGNFKLAVFVDSELDSVVKLTESWCWYIDGGIFDCDLTICTYEQAKIIVGELSTEVDENVVA